MTDMLTSDPKQLASYNNRSVLVTGHTGFKGSWLCRWLIDLGARVTGIALEPETRPNLFNLLDLNTCLTSHCADIRDEATVRRIVQQVEPEIVFHLAAQSLVRRSYADPVATFATNVLGTANVLEAARSTPSVRAVVIVTTDKVYENREWVWPYRETDSLGGRDPYSASKAAAEIVAASYEKSLCNNSVAIATARGGNVIGGGDWSEDRIVPDLVRAISADAPIVLRNPSAIRPWQHVLELCEAYLELGARLFGSGHEFAEAWNFGPHTSEQLTVGELTNTFLIIWDRPKHVVEVKEAALHEAQMLRLDISKALLRLSWRPRLGVHEALAWTARWYKEYYRKPSSARELTTNQIADFGALVDTPRAVR